jgi:hypothetical protein
MADETGGAFVDSTNDLTDGIDRVTADLRQYYLLGYSSSKPPDDKYRTIDVKEGQTSPCCAQGIPARAEDRIRHRQAA